MKKDLKQSTEQVAQRIIEDERLDVEIVGRDISEGRIEFILARKITKDRSVAATVVIEAHPRITAPQLVDRMTQTFRDAANKINAEDMRYFAEIGRKVVRAVGL